MPAPKPGSAHDHTIDRRDLNILRLDDGRHTSSPGLAAHVILGALLGAKSADAAEL